MAKQELMPFTDKFQYFIHNEVQLESAKIKCLLCNIWVSFYVFTMVLLQFLFDLRCRFLFYLLPNEISLF